MTGTPDSIVLDYLKGGVSPNELVLRAIRAYWLPFAYQATGLRNQAELVMAARESILCLLGQIEQLQQAFELEPEELGMSRFSRTDETVIAAEKDRYSSGSQGLSKLSNEAWSAFSKAASLEFDARGL
ncbi:MAG TPA: hypothetical protein DD379_19085 [Cyanobacteria bacterium UBA11162]|nr:hypothetical protein [Cyanobacteria bacterium UBA11162]